MSGEADEKPVVIVLHGPSGVGKDTVIGELQKRLGIHRAISSNSRAPREGEQDGVDYHFLSHEEFKAKIAAGDFLEHAEVYGDLKGLERRELEPWLEKGQDVIIRTDLQGARQWRKILPGAVTVLLMDEPDAVRRRLESRGTEDNESLQRRLAELDAEIADAPNNDYVVYNREGRLAETVDEIERIIKAERRNPRRARVALQPAS